jgi:hypothetical protein
MSHEQDAMPGTPGEELVAEDLPGSGRESMPRAAGGDEGDPVSEVVGDPDLRNIAGFRDADDEGDPLARDEVDDLGSMTDTGIYEGELEARTPDSDQPDDPIAENLEMLAEREFRAGETEDANEAAEEGEAWVAPSDPPVVPGDEGQPVVAAGFGATNSEEPFDEDHHAEPASAEDERTERVLEALRSDASTSVLVDRLTVDTDDGRVFVHGEVDDIDDEDNVVAVAGTVSGVVDVVSDVHIRALD